MLKGAPVWQRGSPRQEGAARLRTELEIEFRQLSQAREDSELCQVGEIYFKKLINMFITSRGYGFLCVAGENAEINTFSKFRAHDTVSLAGHHAASASEPVHGA